MLNASERLEFEEAAKCRDLLASIEQMQSSYAMIIPEKTDIDVAAFAFGLGKVLVSVVQVRQGKVLDHIKLILENELDLPLEEVLPTFLQQYYVPGVFVPNEVLIAKDWLHDDEKIIQDVLSKNKGSEVFVRRADKSWRLDLMNVAEKNVMSALKEDIQQTNLLIELKNLLSLNSLPRNIACFDISTLQGTFTVGSAVFFRDGAPEKNRYRKFKIKEVVGQDDFRSHQEMMRRYIKLLEKEGNPVPDLLLIDGGKGQLNAVKAVLDQELSGNYGLASLAKREEEVFVPNQGEPIDFRGHLKVRHLLQRLRDEAHRFAVGYHRIIRDRQAVTSLLTDVKGIGPSRLRALMNRFESVKDIQEAPLEELVSIPGFSKELAYNLYQTFHSDRS
jgi:excinuclease ABC subunit C